LAFAQTPSQECHTVPVGAAAVGRASPPPRHPFSVSTREPGIRFDLSHDTGEVVARCIGDCSSTLPAGRYVVTLYDTDDSVLTSADFIVTGPGSVTIDPPNLAKARTGMALGIAGPVAIVVGLAIAASAAMDSMRDDQGGGEDGEEPSGDGARVAGLLTIIGGVIITPVGWAMYGTNRSPTVTYTQGPQLGVALLPRKDGGGFGVIGRF
jgi:hypothetical protein